MNQVTSKVFYYKQNGTVLSDLAGNYYGNWRTRGLTGNLPGTIIPVGLLELFSLYDQYKLLAFTVRWFPANVGQESDSQLLSNNGLRRGDVIVYSDQRFDPTAVVPVNIGQVINQGSARMINARRPYKRTLFRASGNPDWGSCKDYANNPDQWDASIEMIINNAQPSTVLPFNQIHLYYYTVQWKVLVRGRSQG